MFHVWVFADICVWHMLDGFVFPFDLNDAADAVEPLSVLQNAASFFDKNIALILILEI